MTTSFYVVTPSRNQLALLKRCIRSVADQAGVRVHHHVQDSASTDGTAAFLKAHRAAVDGRPEGGYSFSYESIKDGGMYDAVNRGWRRASNRFDVYAYLNCDEQYLDAALRRVAGWFHASSDTDVLFGNVLVIASDGTLVCRRDVVVPNRHQILLDHLPVYTAAMFVRQAPLFSGALFFDTTWSVLGDAEWMLRVIDAGLRCRVARQYLSAFALREENLSFSAQAELETGRLRDRAPGYLRFLSFPVKLHHWLRKAAAGAYLPRSVSYDVYRDDDTARTHFDVARGQSVWRKARRRGASSDF